MVAVMFGVIHKVLDRLYQLPGIIEVLQFDHILHLSMVAFDLVDRVIPYTPNVFNSPAP